MEHPIEIFCCTAPAPEDQRYLEKIRKQLSQFVRRGTVSLWDESMIPLGRPRGPEIEQHVKSASIFLLLISADFLASDYCYEQVTKKALERQVAEDAVVVIPVIVRAAAWETSMLHDFQVLPKDLKPLHEHATREQGGLIHQVAEEIVNSIQSFSSSKPDSSPPYAPGLTAIVASSPNKISIVSPPHSPRPHPGLRPPLRPRLVISLIVVSIIVLVGVVVSVISIIGQQNQSRIQATATAQASLTNTAQAQLAATVQANATATQQAIALANATATQQAIALANAAASATAASPTVLITSPANGSTVDLITLVQGTISNSPNGEELWVIVVPDGVNAYYPQPGPVVITGNTWSASATVGDTSVNSQGRGFTLIIALADQSGSSAISAYLVQSKKTGTYPGMPTLPDGVFLQNQIHVKRR
jgi:hypothetical protein